MKLIVACDLAGAIGKNNTLPWHLSDDLKLFKSITTGNTILMGRKTAESLNGPLPNRTNLVLTTHKDLQLEGFTIVTSLEEALEIDPDLFVIGGGELYRLALEKNNKIKEIHLSLVSTFIDDADTFFPLKSLNLLLQIRNFSKIEDKQFYASNKNDFNFHYSHIKFD